MVDDVLSLRKLLQGMLAASMDLSTARYGYVAVVDEELQPVAEVAAGDDRLLPVMQGLAEWAIRAECAVAIRDTGDSGLCRAVAAGEMPRAALVCAPLRSLDGWIYGAGILGSDSGELDNWERALAQLSQAGELILETASQFTGGRHTWFDRSGAYSEEFLHELVAKEASRLRRYNAHFSLVHLGLRLTPRSGTVLGSEAEEAVLAEVVRRIRQTTRRANSLARVGSSAFCLLVPEADDEAAMIVAGNLAEALTESPFHIVAATSSVPVSVEVSALTATDPSEVELEAWWGGGAFPAGTSVIPRFTPDSNVIPLPSVYQAA